MASGIEGDDLVIQTYMSADFREGMEAFLAKRKPVWTGPLNGVRTARHPRTGSGR